MSLALMEKKKLERQSLMTYLAVLHEKFKDVNDIVNADKMTELVKKIKDDEYTIGFCGHFSAGKSSMMNELMKEDVLPSSPIPTSANVVKVKKGPSYARVFYKDEEPIEFPAPYNYDIVKNYCKDGDSILSIEISEEHIQLPEGIAIMDTPGIDSTDDAHRIATESALHLADMILYVMDYNHVQSEQNFMFTKALKEKNKPVYLVINQIDKHNDEELSFAAFKEGVRQSFLDWNVIPDGIFYTSLRDKTAPHNEIKQLEQFLTKQMDNKHELLLESVYHASEQLIEDHLLFVKKNSEEQNFSYVNELSHLSEEEQQSLFSKMERMEERLSELKQTTNSLEQQFEEGLANILKNAYMMPAATRELARDFIESCQSGFKVGVLFAKKKTEQERDIRLEKFYESLKKQVEAQVDWHVKEFIVNCLKSFHMNDESFLSTIYDLTVPFNKELLQRLVKQGAGLTGDYVLNYTQDVSEAIKRLYLDEARKYLAAAKKQLEPKLEKEIKNITEGLKEQADLYDSYSLLKARKEEQEKYKHTLQQVLAGTFSDEERDQALLWLDNSGNMEKHFKKQVMEQVETNQENSNESGTTTLEKRHIKPTTTSDMKEKAQDTITSLRKSYELLKDIKGLKAMARELFDRANRLENRSFTVALFGAFSAGKSSFANSLMGSNVLPVSPNPTTATINKIAPPNEENPHGTVKVMIKNEDHLLKDLSHSLQFFGKDCKTVEEALRLIDKIDYDGEEAKEKPHYAFLKAVQLGYEHVKDTIGKEISVNLETFRDYVAQEEKACFVEWIELYYDCPLTKQGITLVDTPGADSINARHTGVAFDYIKNADAILFVTYYNHAFSKADREFLIQLGRVKETFEMDKMFFVVNAADLAQSKEELNDVVQYIDEQLLAYGIRETRIYPISSKLALEAKQERNKELLKKSYIETFEEDFQAFIVDELTGMAITSAHEEMKQAEHMLEDLLHTANQSVEEKKKQRLEAEDIETQLIKLVQDFEITSIEKAIYQEVEELLFYVKQRVMLRYNDFYNEAFNPSTLRQDGRDMKKALSVCLFELLDLMGFDMSQEMRATVLRTEKFMNQSLRKIHVELISSSKKINRQIHFIAFENKDFPTLAFEKGLTALDDPYFKSALSIFKGPKAFFEQGGKQKMKEKLNELISPQVDSYIDEEKDNMKSFYFDAFLQKKAEMDEKMLMEINEFYEGIFEVLSDSIDSSAIEYAKEAMRKLI